MKNNLLKFTIAAASSTLLLAVLPSGAVPPAPNPPNPVSQPTNAVIGRPGFGQRLGMFSQLEEGTKVLGSPIQITNQTIAKITDVVIDFESGRLLYMVAAVGTNNANNADQFAIAPALLREQHGGKEHVLAFDANKLSAAPKFSPDRTNDPGNLAFLTQVYQYYGVPAWWENSANQIPSQTGAPQGTQQPTAQPQRATPDPGVQPQGTQPQNAQAQPTQAGSITNARTVSTLIGQTVMNSSGAAIGKLDDVIFDFHNQRVPFVILTQTNVSHAVPPMAFVIGPDTQVTTGLDENTLQSAPPYTKSNVQMLANRGTALAIYQHFGKQPYFLFPGGLSPSGRQGQPRVYPGNPQQAPTPAPAPGTTPGATPPIK